MNRIVRIVIVLASILLFVVLVGPFLIPIPQLPDTVPPEQLADPDSRFTSINGLRLHYKTAGSGEPTLVLLHGFAASVHSWREVMGPLAEVGTVIAFDRPGFGLTSRPLPGEWTGENPYSIEAQADITVALLDEFGVGRAVLVGNSAGGTVALVTALQRPERVQALVLVDPSVYAGGGTASWMRPFLRTPQMRRLGPLLARAIRNRAEDFGRSAWHDPSAIPPEFWEGYLKPLRARNWDRALWEVTLAGGDPGVRERLAEIQSPTLVITGDDDRIVPTDQSVRLASELPGAELVVLPDCGHIPQEECPTPFLEAIRTFLARIQ